MSESSGDATRRARMDELLIAYIEAYDEIRACRERLCSHLREGYLSLSQARYSASVVQVSPLNFPRTFSAQKTIAITYPSADSASNEYTRLVLQSPPPVADKLASDLAQKLTLTQRKKVPNFSGHESANDGQPREDCVVTGDGDKKMQKKDDHAPKLKRTAVNQNDPLRWFGIMPPRPLRTCQRSFSLSVDECIAIASTSCRMKSIQDEFNALRRQLSDA